MFLMPILKISLGCPYRELYKINISSTRHNIEAMVVQWELDKQEGYFNEIVAVSLPEEQLHYYHKRGEKKQKDPIAM